MTWVHASDARLDLAPDDLVLLLGGKAANIATMAVELGLPVPPACTITTEACRAFLGSGWPDGLDRGASYPARRPGGARGPSVR